jgi:hypothetical protein
MAKKEYVKPVLTKNEPLVDITFATTTGAVTGAVSVTPGPPATLVTGPKPEGPGALGPDYGTLTGGGATLVGSGMEDLGGSGTITGSGTLAGSGTVIPGTGGAPGTVL